RDSRRSGVADPARSRRNSERRQGGTSRFGTCIRRDWAGERLRPQRKIRAARPCSAPAAAGSIADMSEPTPTNPAELAEKIARLLGGGGGNQGEFAGIARLNRHTARQILVETGSRQLRNSTVSACARALGVSVNDLRTLPLERLLAKMHEAQPGP